MQSQFTRYFAVGVLAVTLAGAALVGESPAQWGRFATSYYVNYNANYYYPVYPAYVAWRPLGGLFAGLHGLLCPGCWHSPCCCVTPVICDPCFDPCCDPCCSDPGGFGYSGPWGYYEQPQSLSVGVPSSTGFGSITPSEGTPGQRPVGVPSVQRPGIPPSIPPTGRTLTTPGTARPSMPGVPDYNGQPNLAPPQNPNGGTFDPASKIESQLNAMPRPGQFVPNVGPIRSNAADDPPTMGSDADWFNRNSSTEGNPSETETAPADGTFPAPSGPQSQGTTIQPGPGSSTTNMMNLGTGTISVTVPDNAKVYINGYETKMPGISRRYIVNDLEPGKVYDYEVRIVAQVNGQTVEETQSVTLTGGQQGVLAFGKPQSQLQPGTMRYVAARPVQ